MIPELLNPYQDSCELAGRWLISPTLAVRILDVAKRVPFGLQIISGFRTAEEQQELIEKGVGAPVEVSTHCSCPATGADLWPTIAITDVVKAIFGANVVSSRLRWGGGSPVDPETGIPSDWNHVDLGPRA
jgi:hypothetical protein